MTITTEEAERLATAYGGFWGLTDVAAALRSLAAERDAAMQWRVAIDDAHTKRLMPIEDNPADALQRLIQAEVNVGREALQARVAELEGALKPFSDVGEFIAKHHPDPETDQNHETATLVRHFRNAYTALEGKKDE